MNIIEYDSPSGRSAFDANEVFGHLATGDLYIRQSNNKLLRLLSPEEKAAYIAYVNANGVGDMEPPPQGVPDLSGLATKKDIDEVALDVHGITLDRRKTREDMLADFEAAWRKKHAA